MTPRRDKGSGSLVDKGGGKYLLRVTHEGRHASRQITAGSRTAAKQRLADFAKEVRDGTFKPIDRTATVTVVLQAWLEQHRDLAPKTRIESERMIRLHLAPHIGHVVVGKLSPQQIDRCYRQLEQTMAAATVRRTHAVLRSALKWAVQQDLLLANPAERVQPPTPKRPATGEVETPHVARMLDLAMRKQPLLGTFVLVCAASGARRGEIADLRWSDVNWEAATLLIDSSASYVGRDGVVSKETKTGRPRRVAIHPAALEKLRDWAGIVQAEAKARGITIVEDECFVFSRDPDKRRPPNPEAISKAWGRLAKEHGFEVRLHDLRHWLASMSLNAGVPSALVANQLGHSPKVLEQVYWHVMDVDRRAVAAFEGAMNSDD